MKKVNELVPLFSNNQQHQQSDLTNKQYSSSNRSKHQNRYADHGQQLRDLAESSSEDDELMKAAEIIEDEADHVWEAKLKQLRGNKERSGDCNVLFTDAELRGWSVQQGEMFQNYGGSGSGDYGDGKYATNVTTNTIRIQVKQQTKTIGTNTSSKNKSPNPSASLIPSGTIALTNCQRSSLALDMVILTDTMPDYCEAI